MQACWKNLTFPNYEYGKGQYAFTPKNYLVSPKKLSVSKIPHFIRGDNYKRTMSESRCLTFFIHCFFQCIGENMRAQQSNCWWSEQMGSTWALFSSSHTSQLHAFDREFDLCPLKACKKPCVKKWLSPWILMNEMSRDVYVTTMNFLNNVLFVRAWLQIQARKYP